MNQLDPQRRQHKPITPSESSKDVLPAPGQEKSASQAAVEKGASGKYYAG